MLNNALYSKDAGRPNLSVEQVAGEGDLQKHTGQAQQLPEDALHDAATAAKTSLLLLTIPSQLKVLLTLSKGYMSLP